MAKLIVEPAVAPFDGLLTTTVANAGGAKARKGKRTEKRVFMNLPRLSIEVLDANVGERLRPLRSVGEEAECARLSKRAGLRDRHWNAPDENPATSFNCMNSATAEGVLLHTVRPKSSSSIGVLGQLTMRLSRKN